MINMSNWDSFLDKARRESFNAAWDEERSEPINTFIGLALLMVVIWFIYAQCTAPNRPPESAFEKPPICNTYKGIK
jgi:hypothetical protein